VRSDADLICFSHLRWDFVYQRPNHLMARAARNRRVYFFEEPLLGTFAPSFRVEPREDGLRVVLPYLPEGLDDRARERALETLLRELVVAEGIERPIRWYYTPMALPFSRWLEAELTVFDCMDELTAFVGAPPRMVELEAELLQAADVVFTGGASLYASKRARHPNVHSTPSAVDAAHFDVARSRPTEPPDQRDLPHPRIGWFGVIDERMDLDLLAAVADLRPDWSIVLIGPVVKIQPADLPVRPNVHVLGARPYAELPAYIGGWDVAIMPFARNAATRYISPTKTLEYLAAGRPVVSTSIHDVVVPYAELGLARIADEPAEFVLAIQAALLEDARARRARADAYLANVSWDKTWARMWRLVEAGGRRGRRRRAPGASGAGSRARLTDAVRGAVARTISAAREERR
jgi:glycosyltransferase involved in cell wall biosynthesis